MLAGTFRIVIHGGSMGHGQFPLSRLDVVSWFGGTGALKAMHADPCQFCHCQREVNGLLYLLVQMQLSRHIKTVLHCSCSQIPHPWVQATEIHLGFIHQQKEATGKEEKKQKQPNDNNKHSEKKSDTLQCTKSRCLILKWLISGLISRALFIVKNCVH